MPVLLLAIVGIVVLSGGGYVAVDKYVDKRVEEAKQEEQNRVKNEKTELALQEALGELDDLRSQNEEDTDEEPEVKVVERIVERVVPTPEPESPPPVLQEIVVPSDDQPGSVAEDASSLCEGIRREFLSFEEVFTDEVYVNAREAWNIYADALDFPEDLSGTSIFKYVANKYTSSKDTFARRVSGLSDGLNRLDALERDDVDLVRNVKKKYTSFASSLESAYNLRHEASKELGDGIYLSSLETSRATYETAGVHEDEALDDFSDATNSFYELKELYDNELVSNSCKGFCDNGYVLFKASCVYAQKKFLGITPSEGTLQTIFTVSGEDFGDSRRNTDQIIVGSGEYADIISWSDTEIKFRPKGIILPTSYNVRVESATPRQEQHIGQIKIIE